MSITNLKEDNQQDYNIEIKYIDDKTKELFYKNKIKDSNEIDASKNNQDLDLSEYYIKELKGLSLKTLEKIKKKLDDTIFFLPPNPIKRRYNSKEEFEFNKNQKSKNIHYLKYMKKMNFLLTDVNKEDEYNPVIPNDFEMILNEITNRKKALKYKKKMQKDIVKKHLAKIEAIANSAKANIKDSLLNKEHLTGQDYSHQQNFVTSWKNVSHNQFDRIKHEEEFDITKIINHTMNLNSGFSTNPNKNAISNLETENDLKTIDLHNEKNNNDNDYINYQNQMIAEKPKIKKDLIGRYLMQKMGWKGQGLGKYEQGIINPLFVKKTGSKYGKIINANSPEDRLKALQNLTGVNLGNPTRILMLTNILTPEEIDQEGIDEIRGECENYGTVLDMKIYNFCNPKMPEGEDVRVFLEYDSTESSVFAFQKLYERYFSTRVIRVNFFNEEDFYNDNLDIIVV